MDHAQPGRGLVSPEWAEEKARHQRRMQLMRMQGETNRLEHRRNWFIALAIILAGLALVLGSMS
jgi:hypothetical protein